MLPGYKQPSLRGFGKPKLVFGCTPGQAAMAAGASLALAWVLVFGLGDYVWLLATAPIFLVIAGVLKLLISIDVHWFEHLTFARMPNKRMSGE